MNFVPNSVNGSLHGPGRIELDLLAWYRDFAALEGADYVDLPPDIIAKLRAMGFRLPERHPARAIPALIE